MKWHRRRQSYAQKACWKLWLTCRDGISVVVSNNYPFHASSEAREVAVNRTWNYTRESEWPDIINRKCHPSCMFLLLWPRNNVFPFLSATLYAKPRKRGVVVVVMTIITVTCIATRDEIRSKYVKISWIISPHSVCPLLFLSTPAFPFPLIN